MELFSIRIQRTFQLVSTHAHVNTSDNSLNYAYTHAHVTLEITDLIALMQKKRRELLSVYLYDFS